MPVHQRNLLILCFTIFLAAAGWNMILPFLPLFLGELGVKTGLAQWSSFIFAAQSLAAIYMQPFWGRLGDRVGRKPMIVRAGLCLAGIYFLMSVCRTPIQLAALRFLNGALTGFIPGSFALIATNTPEEVSGRYVAAAQSASAFGSITGPVLGSILAGIAGYRGSMRLCGIIVLSATMLVLLLVREERRPAPGARSTLLADVREALQLPGMATILGMALLGAAVNPAIQPILALHLRDLHGWHPPWLDGIIYSLPGMALVFLAYTWTCAGERRGRAEVMIRGLVGVALGLVVLTLTGSIWLFGLGYLLVGIFLAAVGPNAAACVASEVPTEKRGRTYGILQAANTLGAFLAPLFAGAVTALLGLRGLFATMAAVVAGVAWMLLVRTKRLRAPGRIAAETAAASSRPADEYR